MVAARPHPFQKVKRIYSYYVNSSTEWGGIAHNQNFTPNIFVDISETIDMKLNAMKEYKSELREYPHPRSIEGIKVRAQSHGLDVGFLFAEPFRLILNTDPFAYEF
jgi:LmbE family N-acetylglucosaminyl deacetylase